MNNQELQNQIQQLQSDMADLKAWKAQRMLQQITYPLDTQSINTIGKYFLRIIGQANLYTGGASGLAFPTLFARQDNIQTALGQDTTQLYTVVASTDVFTVQNSGYTNGTMVVVSTTNAAPSPLVVGTTYYVVSASGLTFKLSATSGGSAINITDVGTGVQYIDIAY